MATVIISNDIRIEHPTKPVADKLIAKYTLANPDYARLERMGKWTGNTPRELALWQRDGSTLILPYGCKCEAERALQECNVPYKVRSDAYNADLTHDYKSGIKLYDYQQNAAEAILEAGTGVLVAPCGSGKTQIGLEVAARLGCKTLWLTHTHELLNQSLDRAKACFDLPEKAFGIITAGKVEIGEVITFATVQTMVRLDLSQYRNVWGCIIVDECHHMVSSPTRMTQFGKVVGSLPALHKVGLTATPKRADGLIECMYAYLGKKVYEISKDEVGDKTCPVQYWQVPTGWDCDIDDVTNTDGTLDYAKLVNLVCWDFQRNNQIVAVVKDLQTSPQSRVLVLTERVAHVQRLAALTGGMELYGGTTKKDRNDCLSALKSGDCRVVVATYQLAKEGLDIPELTHVVFASPNKTDVVITQAAGRVARACKGKDYGTVIDFVDDFLPLQSWAKKRERIYKRLGYGAQL